MNLKTRMVVNVHHKSTLMALVKADRCIMVRELVKEPKVSKPRICNLLKKIDKWKNLMNEFHRNSWKYEKSPFSATKTIRFSNLSWRVFRNGWPRWGFLKLEDIAPKEDHGDCLGIYGWSECGQNSCLQKLNELGYEILPSSILSIPSSNRLLLPRPCWQLLFCSKNWD